MCERRYITINDPKWSCDFCAFWNRIDALNGITNSPCPESPNILPAITPVCPLFMNRFDCDPI